MALNHKKKIQFLVSSCLAGEECRYDCQSRPSEKIIKLVKEGKAMSLCPEQLGNLPTPRPPAEIQKNREVINIEGQNVTKNYKAGAQAAMEQIKSFNIKKAYLKSKSPMCGAGKIYDGSFSNRLIKGDGIFVHLLKKQGIEIEPID